MEVTKFRSQLFLTLEHMEVHLWQKTLTVLGRSVAGGRRVREALYLNKSHLWRLVAISREATAATNVKIARHIFIGLGQVAIHLQRAQNTLVQLGRSISDKPRRLQEALRARENDLRELLASSPDAIVVTDVNHCFVAANPKALVLFGVSEANMRKFTVDIFLPPGRNPEFNGNRSLFRRQNGKYGKCEIRRLDGSLRVAECRFFANFVPSRHLYKFRNVVAMNPYQPATLRTAARRLAGPLQVETKAILGENYKDHKLNNTDKS